MNKNYDLPVIAVIEAAELALENTVSGLEVSNVQAGVIETERHLNDALNDNLQSTVRNVGVDSPMETGQADFKVLLKRKKSGKPWIDRHAKKSELTDLSDKDETGSDSESSDSSVCLSQSDFSGHYEVDDIKLFLRATKNKRGVRINEYFPDIKQFVENTKGFMMEGSFTNKEVYRLKKIVRKLISELSNDDSESLIP